MERDMKIRLETTLGKRVYDKHGSYVGKIEEMRCAKIDGQYRITHYVTGTQGMLERFMRSVISSTVFHLVARLGAREGRQIPSELLPLSGDRTLRTTCAIEELN